MLWRDFVVWQKDLNDNDDDVPLQVPGSAARQGHSMASAAACHGNMYEGPCVLSVYLTIVSFSVRC
jgi:hypothetical protein